MTTLRSRLSGLALGFLALALAVGPLGQKWL